MSQVFISHSHADKGFARKLAADLRKAGHIVWIDEGEINVGDSLIEKIREGIDRVDYVAAVLSKASIESEWIKRELDIASNREIEEKRVVVLPLLIQDVELPGFLKGKFYGDCRTGKKYSDTLKLLLRKFGPSTSLPEISSEELSRLRAELEDAKTVLEGHKAEIARASAAAFKAKSKRLQEAILAANKKFPQHEPINTTYAFEIGETIITLDYLLWSIAKARYRGSHPLEMLLTIYDAWSSVELMIDAYSDLLDAERRRG
jgi:hypothetical protein